MAISTSLIGPYDGFSTYDKVRVMCGVPSKIAKELFEQTFHQRGVQDKILARLFHIFYLEITSNVVQEELANCVTMHEKEIILNRILNKFARLQDNYKNQTDVPERTTPDSDDSNNELH